ncbi:shikimate kinase [Bacteroidia bacterium]|nr:shikimate kinase [Bacteroidia bacterium]MDC1395856.1 shikimate kinase [Bacteroidia bacterium]
MHIFLTGFMGVGKTTIGRELATLSELPFLDLDDEITKHAGLSISSIFEQQGEYAFRQLERDTLLTILKKLKKPHVIALGGGTICSVTNYTEILNNGRCVYLYKPWEELREMLKILSDRPLALHSSVEELEDIFVKREPFYELSQLKMPINTMFSTQKLAQKLRLLTFR